MWQKRYFVLENHYIKYYSTKRFKVRGDHQKNIAEFRKMAPLASVNLRLASSVRAVNDTDFDVIADDGVAVLMSLRASSSDSRDEWIREGMRWIVYYDAHPHLKATNSKKRIALDSPTDDENAGKEDNQVVKTANSTSTIAVGSTVMCASSHVAQGPEELSFSAGDVITLTQCGVNDRWWYGIQRRARKVSTKLRACFSQEKRVFSQHIHGTTHEYDIVCGAQQRGAKEASSKVYSLNLVWGKLTICAIFHLPAI